MKLGGCDGFGYAVGASRRPQKLSHLGNVCIGDEVEIGSNCAIDRAVEAAVRPHQLRADRLHRQSTKYIEEQFAGL